MHNLDDKICPLIGKTCLLEGMHFFQCTPRRVRDRHHQLQPVSAETKDTGLQLKQTNGVPELGPASDYKAQNGRRFPQPNR